MSIILPVYNTGNVLNNTVKSIIDQSYGEFEVIIVDDGSAEYTASLCDELSKQDSRIKVFHKINAGVCSARNYGIDKAEGEYITFCDHDDIYEKDLLKKEMELVKRFPEIDLVSVGARHIYDNGQIKEFGEDLVADSLNALNHQFVHILQTGLLGTIWNVLYKRTTIGTIRFDEEERKGHEDILFNLDVLAKCNGAVFSKDKLYLHYIRNSMSTSAGYHKESLSALKKANNKISENLKIMDGYSDRISLIALQGEYLRTFSTYLVSLHTDYKDFCNQISELNMVQLEVNITDVLKTKSKDVFTYYCIRNKYVRLLYDLLCINNRCKRRE